MKIDRFETTFFMYKNEDVPGESAWLAHFYSYEGGDCVLTAPLGDANDMVTFGFPSKAFAIDFFETLLKGLRDETTDNSNA